MKPDSYVSVKSFGAKGDGVTDDSAAIQQAIDMGKIIEFPDPDVFYLVKKSILLGGSDQLGGKELIGRRPCRGGFGVPLIMGSGGFPLFLVNGVSTQNRSNLLLEISASQVGAPVMSVTYGLNLMIEECFFTSSANTSQTIDLHNSPGISIRESTILCSGGGFALTAYGQCNGLRIINNRLTGGSIGGAVHLEQCQSVVYQGNITEIGVYGLVIGSGVRLDKPGSGPVVGAGASHGINIIGNYFEDVQHPINIAATMAVFGLTVEGNYIGTYHYDNPLITVSRVDGGSIRNNSLWRIVNGSAQHIMIVPSGVPSYKALDISQNHLTN